MRVAPPEAVAYPSSYPQVTPDTLAVAVGPTQAIPLTSVATMPQGHPSPVHPSRNPSRRSEESDPNMEAPRPMPAG